MRRIADVLEYGQIQSFIDRLNAGEFISSADIRLAVTIQTLETIRVGELFVLEAIEAERKADDDIVNIFFKS